MKTSAFNLHFHDVFRQAIFYKVQLHVDIIVTFANISIPVHFISALERVYANNNVKIQNAYLLSSYI